MQEIVMKILFATDGSVQSEHACQFLQRGPFHSESQIHALTIFEPIPFCNPLTPELNFPSYIEYQQMARDHAKLLLDQTKNQLNRFEHVRGVFLEGNPANEIINYAQAHEIDLIVIGSRGLNPFQSWYLGSISSQVVQHAPCAVLVYKDSPEFMEKTGPFRVITGFDDSKSSQHSLDFFFTHFDASRVKQLDILTVMELAYHYGMTSTALLAQAWDSMRDQVEASLTVMKGRCGKQMSEEKVHTYIVEEVGDIAHGLLDFSKRHNGDMLIIGKKGKSLLERLLIGSVTERLLHHAHIPILITHL
jgi:nucleotide-binding universal stress UspA family protein